MAMPQPHKLRLAKTQAISEPRYAEHVILVRKRLSLAGEASFSRQDAPAENSLSL